MNNNVIDNLGGNTYSWPCKHNEHTDRRNNFYFNLLLEDAMVIPAEDDYSEESNADSIYKEHHCLGKYHV